MVGTVLWILAGLIVLVLVALEIQLRVAMRSGTKTPYIVKVDGVSFTIMAHFESRFARTLLKVQGFGASSEYVSSSPIPEPQTYAMMLAGLGLMGFIVRRRSQPL